VKLLKKIKILENLEHLRVSRSNQEHATEQTA